MKNIIKITLLIIAISFPLIVASCSSHTVNCANYRWKVSKNGKYVESEDSSYKFAIRDSNITILESAIIADSVSIAQYQGLEKFIGSVLNDIPLKMDSLLLFLPQTQEFFFTYTAPDSLLKPTSITSDIVNSKKYYTMWIRDDDYEDYSRAEEEIYTNVFFNKKSKRIVVIDRLTYRGDKIARIVFLQTATKKLEKIGLPRWTFHWADITNPERLEIVSHFVDGHREVSNMNYLLGLEKQE